MSTATAQKGHIDKDAVKRAANGRWPEILSAVAGIDSEILDGRNCPCPKCDGTDRFAAFADVAETGGVNCRNCHHEKNSDGFATIQWMLDCSFSEALRLVADYLGMAGKEKAVSGKIVATFQFHDEQGKLLFESCRIEPGRDGRPKDFKQRRPDGKGDWIWSVKGIRVIPYRLRELIRSGDAVVFIPEGEGKCDRLAALDFTATCNAMGAGKWTPAHSEFLRGRHVVILADNDEPGRNHAEKVARSLVGIAASIKVVLLPGLKEKGDVIDWLDAGGTADQLRALVDATSEYKPAAELKPARAAKIRMPRENVLDLRAESGRTDSANAIRFADAYSSELLYIPPWKKWLVFDGRRWANDSGVGAMQRAKRYSQLLWTAFSELAMELDADELGPLQTFIKQSNQYRRIKDFLELAATDERVVCPVEMLNQYPFLLNVENGTIDLNTPELRPHDPADRITQLAPVEYHPKAECPKWLETLDLIFDRDAELIRNVQQLLGYSISGDAGEHILPIGHGGGCNGKSTIWAVQAGILGDYATLANESLLLGESNGHPTEKADLYQKRFVAISEPERGSALREARVKELTGDSIVKARRVNEDFWSFRRTHKFWMSTNHLPRIDGVDDGIWRRVKLIPFAVDLRSKVKPILGFADWLVANEGPGILAWLVRGFQDWKKNGLVDAECVQVATRAYRVDSDALGEFISEWCIVEPDAVETAAELFKTYIEKHGGKWSKTAFGRAMADRFEKDTPTGGEYRRKTIYKGVRLASEFEINHAAGEPSKTAGKQHLSPVVTSSYRAPIDLANSIEGPKQLLTTTDNGSEFDPHETTQNGHPKKLCPGCQAEMVSTPAEVGWQTWDCPNGCAPIPERVMVGQ